MDIFLMFLLLNVFVTSVGGYGWGGGVKVHVHDLYIYTVFITISQNLKSGLRTSKWTRKCTDQWSLSTCKSDRSGLWSLKNSKHFLHKHLDNLPVRLTKCPSSRKNRPTECHSAEPTSDQGAGTSKDKITYPGTHFYKDETTKNKTKKQQGFTSSYVELHLKGLCIKTASLGVISWYQTLSLC